jgi:hypothetical protein
MLAGGFSVGAVDEVHAADSSKVTVIIDFEGYNIGQGYYIEPTSITLPAGSTQEAATRAILEQKKIEYTVDTTWGFQLTGIKADKGKYSVPSYNSDLTYTANADTILGDFDYTSSGGWMSTVNHEMLLVGAADYVLKEGDVIRWQFTVNNYGADLGVAKGYWATPAYTHEDKTELIRSLLAAGNTDSAIKTAKDVIINPLATTDDIAAAIEGLLDSDETDGDENEYDNPISIIKKTKLTKTPVYGNEFTVILQARDGNISKTARASYLDDLTDKIIPILDENNGRADANKSTENSRIILALTSLGVDATDFHGHDLTAALADLDWVKKQGINGPTYALIALDSANYDVPQLPKDSNATQTTRKNLISTITNAQIAGGGWALTGNAADADITGMVLQALAPYYGKKGYEKVTAAVDNAKKVLSKLQHDTKAGFGSILAQGLAEAKADISVLGEITALATPTITAESTAQVLMALDALGISIYHPDFVKNDATTLDALLLFAIRDSKENVTGFKHLEDGEFNYMATELGMLALVSHSLALEGQRFFDMTDTPLEAYKAPETTKPIIGPNVETSVEPNIESNASTNENNVAPITESTPGSPRTSDDMQVQLYLVLAGLSLIIMSGVAINMRRQRKIER